MTDSITREEFHAFIGVIQKGQDETTKEIRELTKNVNAFVVASTEVKGQISHLAHEVSEVKDEVVDIKKDDIKPMKADITKLKIAASNSLLKWSFLLATAAIILGLTTWVYSEFRKPQADTKAAIEAQTEVNKAILELLR